MPLPNGIIDIRSDTTTFPLPEMMEAMMKAPLGDDVYGGDPTVNRLQDLAAEMTGHEAGLFMASGTMGNLVAVLTHCDRGGEAILGDHSHIFADEAGGISALGGVMAHIVPNQPDGSLRLEDIQAAIRPDDIHAPRTRLISIENTQNGCGGLPLSAAYTRSVADLAHARGLKFHIDGARLFNAAAAEGVSAAELASPADSVQFCLSKGLCAPVGSMLCGTRAFIKEARRVRKLVGGGMRQVGVLAAAGIVALQVMPERLHEDHRRARLLAEKMSALPGVELLKGGPRTNMVYVRLPQTTRCSDEEIIAHLEKRGIWLYAGDMRSYRLVTHYWVDDADVDKIVNAFAEILG